MLSSHHLLLFLAVFMLTSLTAIAQDTNRTNPVNPDDPCGQYRDDINDCFYENSVTTSACAACDYTVKENAFPGSCDRKYCSDIQSLIGCCSECKETLDAYADCVFNTGRVIDDSECSTLCSAGTREHFGGRYILVGSFAAAALSSLLFAW